MGHTDVKLMIYMSKIGYHALEKLTRIIVKPKLSLRSRFFRKLYIQTDAIFIMD